MRCYKISDSVPRSILFSWVNLSFTAGAINAGAFLSCQRFVSHVTGFITIAGLNLVHRSWQEALSAMTIPIYFIIGVMISAYLSENKQKSQDRKLANNFAVAIGLVALIMAVEVIVGRIGLFGVFGEFENIQRDYLQLAILCFACGIQNAAVTTATGASIRPTHLTGTTTDLAIGIVRALVMPRSSVGRRQEKVVAMRRIYLIGSFVAGAILSSYLYAEYDYFGFLLPFFTSMVTVFDSLRQARALKSGLG